MLASVMSLVVSVIKSACLLTKDLIALSFASAATTLS